jgi:hypothetical protein
MANNDELVGMIRAIMAEERGCPLSIFRVAKMFSPLNKVGYFTVLDVDILLVRPANRGGGLGTRSTRLGLTCPKLKQACCVQMHPMGKARDLEAMK